MSSSLPIQAVENRPAQADFLGHPPALPYLFATEMWERFSYYGMRALLVLYMVKYVLQPETAGTVIGLAALKHGLEALFGPLDIQPLASQVYGLYTGLVYLTPVLGGFLADRVLGQRRTVIVGASLMAIGHFMMAFEQLLLFALALLILGNGAFKPNMSAQVGGLYPRGDPRRDRAYSIFYVGINLGAFLAPLVCGTLGERAGWHYGFAAAGVGMLIGLAIYLHAYPKLPPDRFFARQAERPLGPDERRAIAALMILFVPTSLFWATYEQQGNTIALWADEHTDRTVDLLFWSGEIPTTWFQSFNPLMIFAFTPFVVAFWARQARRGVGALHARQDGAGLLRLRSGQRDHGGRRPSCRARQGELAVARCLLRDHHHRRALHLPDRAFPRLQGRPAQPSRHDDGGVAGDELHREFPRRLSRQFLVVDGETCLLRDDRGRRIRGRYRDLGIQPALACGTSPLTRICLSKQPDRDCDAGRPALLSQASKGTISPAAASSPGDGLPAGFPSKWGPPNISVGGFLKCGCAMRCSRACVSPS